MSTQTLLFVTPTQGRIFELKTLQAVGGAQSSGLALSGLKEKDDYAVLSPVQDGVAVHPLKGKARNALQLETLKPIALQDLQILLLPELKQTDATTPALSHTQLNTLLRSFAEPQDMNESMAELLHLLLQQTAMDRGLVITRTPGKDFRLVANVGVDSDDAWISETLVQQTLKTGQPVIVQNIIGSSFDSKKSLVASGFLSVFSFPLLVRGECLGALLIGSKRPHSGLSISEREGAEVLVGLGALMLSFQLKDETLREEIAALKEMSKKQDLPLLTSDPQLIDTCRTAARVAKTDLAVLIQGETGVGKELLAQHLHQESARAAKPFIAINCGAIPSELLESILFGHKKGAFTGAHSDQKGKFLLADGGTLFLDEIGDLPLHLQVKLLRTLQEKVIEPVGSEKPIPVDVRLISASLKNVLELSKTGKFRSDLYYRLAEITLTISPLRARPDDIGLLAMAALKEFAPEKRFSQKCWTWLRSQPWPGNVRELRSAVKRAAVLNQSTEIEIRDMDVTAGIKHRSNAEGDHLESGVGPLWLGASTLELATEKFVHEKLHEALRLTGGHRHRAAELLGITPRTLFRYLKESPEIPLKPEESEAAGSRDL